MSELVNPSPKTVLLQGEPGSGKSQMGALTAINKPVHVVDIDRKVQSAAWAQAAIKKQELTYWELKEPIDDSNIKARIYSLVTNAKPNVQPMGWTRFADYVYEMPKSEDAKRAGTWMFDSLTIAGEHLKTHIMFLAGKSKYEWDQWNAYKIGWLGTLSVLRDLAKENGKDLILTVHERQGEIPGEKTRGVEYTVDAKGNRTRNILGVQDMKVWASIDGAAGQLIGAEMDEYYHLFVEMIGDKPVWKCRVRPDGLRNLRTTFKVDKDEYNPDFKEIWK